MPSSIDRREFLTASASLAAGLGVAISSAEAQTTGGRRGGAAGAQTAAAPAVPLTFKTKLHKALIARPTEEDLTRMKAAGFEGVEGRASVTPDDAAKIRVIADKLGMRVHSVLYGWALFNSPNKADVDRTFAESQAALRTAEAFGADAVLLVPCHIGERSGVGSPVTMPRAWEFQIEYDDKTGHLTRVVYSDNARFADYIKAHNHATDTSREWVSKLIPLAQTSKVVIALENVGNRLWVTPDIFAHFVRSFRSPWVKAYYDIGNHVRYAPPEQWILALGDLVSKIHVKDYKVNPADPNGMGQGVNIREGDVRWPVLRQALEAVNYNGWMTIESNGDIPFEERNRRLDLIISGV
jgi:hexulose-6-phosphate isomerase